MRSFLIFRKGKDRQSRQALRLVPLILFCSLAMFLQAVPSQAEEEQALVSADDALALEKSWNTVAEHIQAGDFAALPGAFDDLERVQNLLGLSGLETMSLRLLSQSRRLYDKGEKEHALYILREAMRLAPRSARFRLESLPLRSQLESLRFARELSDIVLLTAESPNQMLRVLSALCYPVLWALSLGLFLGLFLLFLFERSRLLSLFQRGVCARWHPFCALFLVLALLFGFLALGPLWTLATWTLFAYKAGIPLARRFAALVALLFCLWSVVLPARESLEEWLSSPALQGVMAIAEGSAVGGDRALLEGIRDLHRNDPVIHYTLGQLYRREGNLEQAKQAFAEAAGLQGASREILAQQAVLEFLHGNNEAAERLFAKAEEQGLATPEFFVNVSRLQFAMLRTGENERFLKKAYEKNAARTALHEEREKNLGILHPRAVAEMPLPWFSYVRSALRLDGQEIRERVASRFQALGIGLHGKGVLALGVLVLVYALRTGRARRRSIAHDVDQEPGGEQLLDILSMCFPLAEALRRGRLLFACLGFALLFLLCFPFLAWPSGCDHIFYYLGRFSLLYVLCFLLCMLLLWFLGHREGGEGNTGVTQYG